MARIAYVRVAIVDVGANTLRLLVATREEGRLVAVREQRVQLSLGEDIEHSGRIGELKLAEAAAIASAHVRRARKLGCDRDRDPRDFTGTTGGQWTGARFPTGRDDPRPDARPHAG